MQYNFLSFIFGHKSLSIRMLGMPPPSLHRTKNQKKEHQISVPFIRLRQ